MDTLCTACLCAGRNLVYLNTDAQCFNVYKQILNEIPEYNLSLICVRICWQCHATLKRFKNFRSSTYDAYNKLLDALQQGTQDYTQIVQPSLLTICKVEDTTFPLTIVNIKTETESSLEFMDEIKTEPTCPLETETHNEPVTFVNNLEVSTEIEKKLKKDKIKVTRKKPQKSLSISDDDRAADLDFNSDCSSDCSPIIELKTKKTKHKKGRIKPVALKNNHIDKLEKSVKLIDKLSNKKLKITKNNKQKTEKPTKLKDFQHDVKDHVKDGLKEEEISEVILTPEEITKEREEDMKSDKFIRNKFNCNSCVLVCKNWLTLQEHNKNCHDESIGPHSCSTCLTRFPSLHLLSAHMPSHSLRYDCARCLRRERDKSILLQHMKTHYREEKDYVCEICEVVSSSLSHHQLHMSKAHDEKPKCVECGKVFSSRKTYRYHLNVLHKGQNRFPCPHCGKIYQWKSNLWRHIKNHKAKDTGELYCKPCDKKFSSIATYRQHIKISRRHVSESEFSFMCNECGRKFVSKSKLRDHVDWEHLNKINYRCQLCNKPFKSGTSLYVHLQNVHRNKEEKDNLCHVCGKSYQSTAKLKYHIVAMHTAQTPYSCSQCGAAFSWYSSLYRHIKEVHDKIKINKKPRKSKKMIDLLTSMPQHVVLPSLHPGPA